MLESDAGEDFGELSELQDEDVEIRVLIQLESWARGN